jgi:hypothetical protein
MTFDSLKYERDKFRKRTAGLSGAEVEWIISRFVKEYPKLSGYKNDPKTEEELLDRINLAIYDIGKDKPADIRAYVEKHFRKTWYDARLKELEGRIWNLHPGKPEEEYDRCRKELKKLLGEADKEFPGYTEKKGRRVSEMYGDLMALSTNGEKGSTRMMFIMTAAKMAEEDDRKAAKKKR